MLKGVIGVAFASLLYAIWLWKDTISNDKGTAKMQQIWMAIKLGAQGYLNSNDIAGEKANR